MACFGHASTTDASCTSFFSQQSATKPVNAHLMSRRLERGDGKMLHRCCETGFRWGGRSKCVCISATLMPRDSVCLCVSRGVKLGVGCFALTDSTEGRVKLAALTVNFISRSLISLNRGLILRSRCRGGMTSTCFRTQL